jgi:hypothetical protein
MTDSVISDCLQIISTPDDLNGSLHFALHGCYPMLLGLCGHLPEHEGNKSGHLLPLQLVVFETPELGYWSSHISAHSAGAPARTLRWMGIQDSVSPANPTTDRAGWNKNTTMLYFRGTSSTRRILVATLDITASGENEKPASHLIAHF